MNTSQAREVFAINFPNYHRYPHNDAWFGEGWTEWDLIKTAPPRFGGHYQPLQPSWGKYDESDPAWASREIDLAADHGITGFLIDWYWYSGVQLMQDQLEKGFLKAPNRKRLKFALMWANHPWMNNFPTDFGKTSTRMNCLMPIRHTLDDMARVADYCVEHYFNEPNYWKIEGKPYFSFFSFGRILEDLGGIEGVRQGIESFQERVRAAGFPGAYLGVNIGSLGGLAMSWDTALIASAKEAGFDSVFGYAIARPKDFQSATLEKPFFDYQEIIEAHEFLWKENDGRGLPFFPTVSMGYDCSARWSREQKIPLSTLEYPYEPIIINNTPERYGELCDKACAFLNKSASNPKAMFLFAWNEWTEGSYLLPEKRHGLAYLEALRQSLSKT